LPDWLRELAGLPDGATVEALSSESVAEKLESSRRRIRRYFSRLIASPRADVRCAPILDRPWPPLVDPRAIRWPAVVRRALTESGLIDDAARLSLLTYGELLALPRMGSHYVLDFALAAQWALDNAYEGAPVPLDHSELEREAASAPWAELVSDQDPRFADLLAGGEGTVADRLRRSANGASHEAPPSSAIPVIFERIAQIEQSPLDVAMRAYVRALSGLEDERLDAVLGRLGLDGRPPRKLALAVNGAHVSPERVRQLEVRTRSRLPSHPIYMPALDKALEALAIAAPSRADDCALLLATIGVSSAPFHPASVLAAARLCGRPASFELEETLTGTRVVARSSRAYARQLVRMATERIRAVGAASLAELVCTASGRGLDLSEDEARDVLLHHSPAELLLDDWVWLPDCSRDRLSTLTRRILAVASPLEVTTIRAGVCRAYTPRGRTLLPPTTVMSAFYAAHPGFEVDERGRIRPVQPLDPATELRRGDRILVDVLRSSWIGVLDRATFQDACLTRGMAAPTFNFYSSRSVVLAHPAADTWCLVGTRVSAVTMAALRYAKGGGKEPERPDPADFAAPM
jgi:hypothetical protein